MRKNWPRVLIVIGSLGFVVFCFWMATYQHSMHSRLDKAIHEYQESREGLAFAAGFLYGQRSIILAAGLPIPSPKINPWMQEFRTIASKNGFTTADRDPGDPLTGAGSPELEPGAEGSAAAPSQAGQ